MVHQGRRLAIGFLVLICSVNQGTLSADISLPTPSLPRRGSRTRLPPVVARVGTSGQLANAAGFVSAPGRAAALAPHSDVATCKRLGAAPALGPVMFWGESLMDNAGAWARGIRAPSALPPHKMSAVKVCTPFPPCSIWRTLPRVLCRRWSGGHVGRWALIMGANFGTGLDVPFPRGCMHALGNQRARLARVRYL